MDSPHHPHSGTRHYARTSTPAALRSVAPLLSHPKAPRACWPEDLDVAIAFHGAHIHRVQLWRTNDTRPASWVYFGRLRPARDMLEWVRSRFGAGWYRAKLLGAWLPAARREVFLQQICFGIGGAPTLDTIRRLARRGLRATAS
jgi:hypothetical protein